jgi:circadian clock protein KaiB
MDLTPHLLPPSFKGLALITPGGDLVSWIDPDKQGHWHAQLCEALAELLDLPDIPLFLVDEFTATVDRYIVPASQRVQVLAEAQPRVWRYRPILNILFGTSLKDWKLGKLNRKQPTIESIEHYRVQYPQLWQNHNLMLRLDKAFPINPRKPSQAGTSGYVFRFYINGQKDNPVQLLEKVHRLLEQELKGSYTLRVIDVTQNPALAEQDQISATPTLVKLLPLPKRRLIGSIHQDRHLTRLFI